MMICTIFAAKKPTVRIVWKFKTLPNQRNTWRCAQKYVSYPHNYSQRIDSRTKPSLVKNFSKLTKTPVLSQNHGFDGQNDGLDYF